MDVFSVVGLGDLFSDPNKVWIVLATESEVRATILRNNLRIKNVLMMGSGFKEDLDKDSYTSVGDYCKDTAEQKAHLVAQRIFSAKGIEEKTQVLKYLKSPFAPIDKDFDLDKIQLVIGADTAGDYNGIIYEKPQSREEAKKQLVSYTLGHHYIHTGVGIFVRSQGYNQSAAKFYDTTRVKFQTLSDVDIERLLDTEEYKGTAGSYRVSGVGESLIEYMDGSYTNIMGLPAQKVSSAIAKIAKTYKLN
ncbi:septum formation protein MAF, putative [Theileria equi strain WA]|uniref:Septum formation protein MAF, putative n=1 Tax=Theileria equi strain WA TaxID=1537102 RepID=L0B358_THEEQ|nr:septum formation protein MAF, putative [Theileria equi strain WA]AFZ81549.1 septum formation protein MAF, putative [Theileria equi strain WA]|eukprot:XP_004831215.1 septum formation protein MAF, putative [Theileria equi strain WA]